MLAARRMMRRWCLEEAGARIHGTTQRCPLEHFLEVDQVHLAAPIARPCHGATEARPLASVEAAVSIQAEALAEYEQLPLEVRPCFVLYGRGPSQPALAATNAACRRSPS